MNQLLADWYNEVSIALPSEALQARSTAADQLLPSLTRTRVLVLVGLAHGEDVPSSVELRWRPDDHQATFTVSS
jgi:hypothetical protein